MRLGSKSLVRSKLQQPPPTFWVTKTAGMRGSGWLRGLDMMMSDWRWGEEGRGKSRVASACMPSLQLLLGAAATSWQQPQMQQQLEAQHFRPQRQRAGRPCHGLLV